MLVMFDSGWSSSSNQLRTKNNLHAARWSTRIKHSLSSHRRLNGPAQVVTHDLPCSPVLCLHIIHSRTHAHRQTRHHDKTRKRWSAMDGFGWPMAKQPLTTWRTLPVVEIGHSECWVHFYIRHYLIVWNMSIRGDDDDSSHPFMEPAMEQRDHTTQQSGIN